MPIEYTFSERLAQLFLWLNDNNFIVIAITLGVVLILVDYFFATDIPCQISYVLFALAITLAVPYTPVMSLIVGVISWVIILLLHILLFRNFLTNSPNTVKHK